MLEINNVYNMDCLEGLKLVESSSIALILTDPPYEVDYNNKSKHLERLGKSRDKQVLRDASFVDTVPSYEELSNNFYRVLNDDGLVFLFCGDRQIVKWTDSMTKAGFKHPQILVWKKNKTTFDMTFGHKFPENKEFILFFQKGWKKLNTYKIERGCFRSVLEFDSSNDTTHHSCSKPIRLLSFLIKLSTEENDIILDTFVGGGNHIISAIRTNRRYIGFELSKEYYDTITRRLSFEKKQELLMEG